MVEVSLEDVHSGTTNMVGIASSKPARSNCGTTSITSFFKPFKNKSAVKYLVIPGWVSQLNKLLPVGVANVEDSVRRSEYETYVLDLRLMFVR